MSAAAPDAVAILRDLEAALAPPGGGPAIPNLSVRLEQHDEAAAWSETGPYVIFLAAFAGVAVVGLAAFVARPAGVYVIRGGDVSWRPAVDANRVVTAVAVVLVVGALARAVSGRGSPG